MKTRIQKTASRGVPPSPVANRPWQESVDEFALHLDAIVEQESQDAVVELWLDDPRSFMEGLAAVGEAVHRLKTGGHGLRRYDPMGAKTASSSSWGEQFADAKAHADAVLKNLGSD